MDRWINESVDRPTDPPVTAFPGRIYRIRRSTDPPRVCDIFQCADPRSFNLDNRPPLKLSRSARRVVTCVSNIKMSDTWRSTVFDIVINQKTSADGFSVYTSFIFSFLGKQSHIIIWFHLLLFNTALWELKHSLKFTKKKLTETNEVRG